MKCLEILHPFGRMRRLIYMVVASLCLAAGWAGLNVIRFGGDFSLLGHVLFWPALWLLFCAMVNRTRDADASAGWVLFPVLVSIVSIAIALQIGRVDIAGHLVPGNHLMDKVAYGAVSLMTVFLSYLLPLMIALALSAFFWALSIAVLAILPSRAGRVPRLRK